MFLICFVSIYFFKFNFYLLYFILKYVVYLYNYFLKYLLKNNWNMLSENIVYFLEWVFERVKIIILYNYNFFLNFER